VCLTGAGWICAVDRGSGGWRGAHAGVDRAVDHGPRVHGRPAEGVTPRLNLGRPLWIGRPGTHVSGAVAGTAVPGGARRMEQRQLAGGGPNEAPVHHFRRGLDREEEKNGAKLTRGLLTAVARCKRHAAKRGRRDHGRSPGRGLRPRFGASGRRGAVPVIL
jgi:hypothetical protein